MAKIAVVDNKSMNQLYTSELKSRGIKVAGSEDPQAFKDHKDYMDTLEEVLREDKTESWDPNDMILD